MQRNVTEYDKIELQKINKTMQCQTMRYHMKNNGAICNIFQIFGGIKCYVSDCGLIVQCL